MVIERYCHRYLFDDWPERSFTDCGLRDILGCFCWPERSFVDCGLRDILDVSVGG